MNIQEIGTFIAAGNAVFSLTNSKTGKRYIYKVCKHKNFDHGKRQWSVMIRCRMEGESDFGYIGTIKDRQFSHNMYSIVGPESDEFGAFEHLFLQVIRGKNLPRHLRFEHMGRCGRCGRLLTDPVSVERGLGPDCAEEMLAVNAV